MAKMMWRSADKVFRSVFLLTLCLTLCLTAPAEEAKADKPLPAEKKDGSAAVVPPKTDTEAKPPAKVGADEGKTKETNEESKPTKSKEGNGGNGNTSGAEAKGGSGQGTHTVGNHKQGNGDKAAEELQHTKDNSQDVPKANANDVQNDVELEDEEEETEEEKSDNLNPVVEQPIPRRHSDSESASGGSFMTYFIATVIVLVLLYIGFHNRHKILAYIVEGRRGRSSGPRRRGASGSAGGATVEYRPLNSAAADELLNAGASRSGGSNEEGKPDYMY